MSFCLRNIVLLQTSFDYHVVTYGTNLIRSVWWQLGFRTHAISSEERKMFSNWCQDYSSVNNSMISRNEILNEVNKILQTLNSIVYKLSVSQSVQDVNVSQDTHPDFLHEEMWWDEDFVSLSMSVPQDVNNNSYSSECSSVLSDTILQDVQLFSDKSDDDDVSLSIAD